ncbi:MAG: hypothetical protein ACOX3T_08150 [Bdellovibrionota bacterium]
MASLRKKTKAKRDARDLKIAEKRKKDAQKALAKKAKIVIVK